MHIFNIRCELQTSEGIEALRKVLNVISERFTEDFDRIRARTVRVAPHPNPEPGDLGECKPHFLDADTYWSNPELDTNPYFEDQVEVFVVEEGGNLVATIAHELGHAASTKEQKNAAYKDIVEHEGWAGEAVADLYALKWGFADELEESEPNRDREHHKISLAELKKHVGIVE